MKKVICLILALIMTVTVFSGCGKILKLIRPDNEETQQTDTEKETTETKADTVHTHTFGEWYTVKQPTCTDDGYEERVCSGCNEKETRTLSALGHDYGDNGVCSRCGDFNDKRFESELAELKNAYVGSYVAFGKYEQDNSLINGKEDIEWLVLDREGTNLLLISRYALDCKNFNEGNADITWENCSLRRWLNQTFINGAFSVQEQKVIQTVNVSADKNPDFDISSGNNTTDKIFVLSITEAYNYFSYDSMRQCNPTDYAVAQGVYPDNNYMKDSRPTCWWWLRTPGDVANSAAGVRNDGSIGMDGFYFKDINDFAVRPALWVNVAAICSVTVDSHKYGSWYTVSQPSCTAHGVEERVCSDCGTKETRRIPALGHSYGTNGKCTRCGEKDPAAVDAEYLEFTLLSDGSYEVRAKDVNNIPTSVAIPEKYNGRTVTAIANKAFYGCSSLKNITIPDSVTTIGDYAFYNCTALLSMYLPHSVKSTGWGAFAWCNSLIGFEVDRNNSYYSSYDGVLFNKNKTEIISYPNAKARTYTIPNGVTSIYMCAFRGCTNLTSITIPDSVTAIREFAFVGCESLTTVTIPDKVTTLGEYAFSSCTGLMTVTVPRSITKTGDGIFWNCSSLTDIIFNGTVSQWYNMPKGEVWDDGSGYYTVYCTDGEIYK